MCNCIYKYFVKTYVPFKTCRFRAAYWDFGIIVLYFIIVYILYSAATNGIMFVYNYIATVNKFIVYFYTYYFNLLCHYTLTYTLHILNIHL